MMTIRSHHPACCGKGGFIVHAGLLLAPGTMADVQAYTADVIYLYITLPQALLCTPAFLYLWSSIV